MGACTSIMDGEWEESLKLVAFMLFAGEQISFRA
jgi:hypothetical protein